MTAGPIITDPNDRTGLRRGSVVDWLQTLALAPLLPIAVLAVGLLAADSRRKTRRRKRLRNEGAAAPLSSLERPGSTP